VKRHTWGIYSLGEGNIKMDIEVTGQKSVDWIYLAGNGGKWPSVVNTVVNLLVL
jgi:hypothetical protein